MPRTYAIESEYKKNFVQIPPDFSELKLQYSAPVSEGCDLEQVRVAVEAWERNFNGSHRAKQVATKIDDHSYIAHDAQGKEHECLDVVVSGLDVRKQPRKLDVADIRSIYATMRGEGVITDKAASYIFHCCDGNPPETQECELLVNPNDPAAAQGAQMVAGLLHHYQSCTPKPLGNALQLNYLLTGYATAQNVQDEKRDILNSIVQALKKINPRSGGTEIELAFGSLTQTTQSLPANAQFEVVFSRKLHPGNITKPLEHSDVDDLTKWLLIKGCMRPFEVADTMKLFPAGIGAGASLGGP